MALLPVAPEIRLLIAIKQDLLAVDFEDLAGVKMATIRHHRNRNSLATELSCIAIRWVGVDDNDVEPQYKSAGEWARRMEVDLEIDLKLAAEDSGQDDTGWETLSRVGAAAVGKIRSDGSETRKLAWWVTDLDSRPDEDSEPDEGRLVRRISVVYRVLAEDTNVLLTSEENA